jgi:hypothetical protein
MYKDHQLRTVLARANVAWLYATYLFLEQGKHLPDISPVQTSLVLHLLQRGPTVKVFGAAVIQKLLRAWLVKPEKDLHIELLLPHFVFVLRHHLQAPRLARRRSPRTLDDRFDAIREEFLAVFVVKLLIRVIGARWRRIFRC